MLSKENLINGSWKKDSKNFGVIGSTVPVEEEGTALSFQAQREKDQRQKIYIFLSQGGFKGDHTVLKMMLEEHGRRCVESARETERQNNGVKSTIH